MHPIVRVYITVRKNSMQTLVYFDVSQCGRTLYADSVVLRCITVRMNSMCTPLHHTMLSMW